jgi:DNA-nicking Smr family endonuclease
MDEQVSPALDLPIDGILDLHTFRPQDAASVVEEYLHACAEEGILEVRIIHGKGKGALRRTVHAALSRHPLVLEFSLDSGPSGWGATVVHLNRQAGN